MSAALRIGRARAFLSAYRWPIFLGGLLVMSIAAQGILVFVATRPDSPRPIADYYRRSLDWDTDTALLEASRQLGWTVRVEVPSGREYAVGARRPVDITVRDRDGVPVSELRGRLVAVRPADVRLNGESELVELPHRKGSYRTLAALPAAGLWQLHLDAHRGDTHFVHTARVVLPTESAP